jgi:hypothetical protein
MKLMIVLGTPLALIVTAAIVIWVSGVFFAARIDELRSQLVESQKMPRLASNGLPAIVRNYAVRAGGRIGAPAVFHAKQEATLATDRNRPPIDINAEQWTGTVEPGIVWVAQGSMNALPVTVFDAYVEGRGELSARVLGTVQVAGGSGADYDKGELQRYLSELPVYPDAILNNAGLTWREIDDRTVEVSARSRSGTASLRFYFDENGDIVRSEADDRPMAGDGGRTLPTPWHGIFAEYKQFGQYRIPSYGEVGWMLDDGLFTYWRGRLVSYEPLGALAK